MDRSYHGENRPSHQHWARKHHWAKSVVRLGGTTCEPLVTICFAVSAPWGLSVTHHLLVSWGSPPLPRPHVYRADGGREALASRQGVRAYGVRMHACMLSLFITAPATMAVHIAHSGCLHTPHHRLRCGSRPAVGTCPVHVGALSYTCVKVRRSCVYVDFGGAAWHGSFIPW